MRREWAGALIVRIGALGDVLLTRRLAYSLSLAGLRSTVLAPKRHATLLLADPWIDGVLDSESPRYAPAFAGRWPTEDRFKAAIVISQSPDLMRAAASTSEAALLVVPSATCEDVSIARQWAEAAQSVAAPFSGVLPNLQTVAAQPLFAGAAVIHPGSGSVRKNWPFGSFLDLGRALRRAGHRVLWVVGPAEVEVLEPPAEFELMRCPPLDILAATLAQAKLFVGNDAGVSHLAAAVGTPTVALFGPTDPAVWRPDGARVKTIHAATGELKDISVESVLEGIEDLIGRTRLET